MSKTKRRLARLKANRKLLAARAGGVEASPSAARRPSVQFPPYIGTVSRKQIKAAVEAVARERASLGVPAS